MTGTPNRRYKVAFSNFTLTEILVVNVIFISLLIMYFKDENSSRSC